MKTPAYRIILLPGVYGTGRMFGPLLEVLPEQYDSKIISYPTQEVLSYTQLADYVEQRIPLDKPCIILAESFAGPIALQLSQRLGDQLKAMILVCSFVKNPHPFLSLFSGIFLHDRLLGIPPTRFMAKFMITGFHISDDLLDLAFEIQRSVSATVFRCRLQEAMKVDVSEYLRDLSIPLLHMYAKHDRVIPRSAQRLIKRIRPDIQSVALEGPHYLLQTRAQQSMQHIQCFLESI